MACFAAPLAEAIIVTAIKSAAFSKRSADKAIAEGKETRGEKILTIREKIGWLQKLLYGGSFLLAIEHIYHGEVVLYPPFLTAMKNPEDIPEMLHEIATVGVGMAVLTTVAWGIMLAVSALRKRKANKAAVQGAA